MRNTLLFCLLLLCLNVARAATVIGSIQDSFEVPYGGQVKTIEFNPLSTPQAIGTNTVWPVVVTKKVTNGVFSVNLVGGIYWAGLLGDDVASGGAKKTVKILVPPSDTNTYTFNQVAALATNLGTFAYTNQYYNFVGDGGGITNIQASNVVGIVASDTITNNQADVTLTGTFSGPTANFGVVYGSHFEGDGSGISNIPSSAITGLVAGTSDAIDAGGVPTTLTMSLQATNPLVRAYVHPNYVNLKTNLHGHQYWGSVGVGFTNDSWPNTKIEFPQAMWSDDFLNWHTAGVEPTVHPTNALTFAGMSISNGWVADNETYVAPDGTIHTLFMAYEGSSPWTNAFYSTIMDSFSVDGTNWNLAVIRRDVNTNKGTVKLPTYVGPQVVRDHTNGLRLYFVDDGQLTQGTNILKWVAAVDESGTNWNWATENDCTLLPFGTTSESRTAAPWHFALNCVDGIYHLFYGDQNYSWTEYSTSTNGLNFIPAGNGVLSIPSLFRGYGGATYKSAFRPVPGPNGLAWDVLAGLTPFDQSSSNTITGWTIKALRGFVVDPSKLSYNGGNTNWTLLGADLKAGGFNRVGALTVAEGGVPAALGSPLANWAGLALGRNAAMSSSNYAIASDGNETRVNTRTGSALIFAAANSAMGGFGTGGGFTVGSATDNSLTTGQLKAGQIFGDGGGLTGIQATNIVGLGTNSTTQGTNVLSSGSTLGQVLTATASGAAWSNAPSGGISAVYATNLASSPTSGYILASQNGGTNMAWIAPQESSYPFTVPTRLCIEGDSLTFYSNTNSVQTNNWPYWLTSLYLTNFVAGGTNTAATGKVMYGATGMSNDYPKHALFKPSGGTNAVYFLWGGVNDVNNGQTYATITSYLSNMIGRAKSDGFFVVNFTITESVNFARSAAKERVRRDVNLWIRTNGMADVVIDTDFLFPSSSGVTTDGTHFFDSASRRIAGAVWDALRTKARPSSPLVPAYSFDFLSANGAGYSMRGVQTGVHIYNTLPILLLETQSGGAVSLGQESGGDFVMRITNGTGNLNNGTIALRANRTNWQWDGAISATNGVSGHRTTPWTTSLLNTNGYGLWNSNNTLFYSVNNAGTITNLPALSAGGSVSDPLTIGTINATSSLVVTNPTSGDTVFTASQTGVTVGSAYAISGVHAGDGSGLTSLNADQLSSGVLPMGRLTTNTVNTTNGFLQFQGAAGRQYTRDLSSGTNLSQILGGGYAMSITDSTEKFMPWFGVIASSGETAVASPIPKAGWLSKAYFVVNQAPGTGTNYTFKIYTNGTFCGLSAVLGAGQFATNDLATITASLAAGSVVSVGIKSSYNGAHITTYFRWCFLLTN